MDKLFYYLSIVLFEPTNYYISSIQYNLLSLQSSGHSLQLIPPAIAHLCKSIPRRLCLSDSHCTIGFNTVPLCSQWGADICDPLPESIKYMSSRWVKFTKDEEEVAIIYFNSIGSKKGLCQYDIQQWFLLINLASICIWGRQGGSLLSEAYSVNLGLTQWLSL